MLTETAENAKHVASFHFTVPTTISNCNKISESHLSNSRAAYCSSSTSVIMRLPSGRRSTTLLVAPNNTQQEYNSDWWHYTQKKFLYTALCLVSYMLKWHIFPCTSTPDIPDLPKKEVNDVSAPGTPGNILLFYCLWCFLNTCFVFTSKPALNLCFLNHLSISIGTS